MPLIKCPNCNEDISDKADKCIHCGVELTPKSDKQFCADCGNEILEGETICNKCGCPVEQVEKPVVKKEEPSPVPIQQPVQQVVAPESPKKNNKTVKIIIFVVIALLVLGGAGFGIYTLMNGESEDPTPTPPKRDINGEIRAYIINHMPSNWDYASDKVNIDENHAVDIRLNNAEEWSYCGYFANNSMKSLINSNSSLLKEIPTITFTCYNGAERSGKAVYENISEITSETIEKNAKYYNGSDDLMTETVASAFKKTCKSYKYKDIFRNPDEYVMKRAKVTGEVIQVMEQTEGGVDYWVLRVNMTKESWGYTDTIMVMIEKAAIKGRIIEDDIYNFYGLLSEPVTYTTVMGAEQTIPSMLAFYGDLVK